MLSPNENDNWETSLFVKEVEEIKIVSCPGKKSGVHWFHFVKKEHNGNYKANSFLLLRSSDVLSLNYSSIKNRDIAIINENDVKKIIFLAKQTEWEIKSWHGRHSTHFTDFISVHKKCSWKANSYFYFHACHRHAVFKWAHTVCTVSM